MATQFIVNEKGEKTAVVLSLEEYERLLNQNNSQQLSEEYKLMINQMLAEEENGTAECVFYQDIKLKFFPDKSI